MTQPTTRTYREILVETRALIARGWAQHTGGLTDAGVAVGWDHREARRFCITGAIHRAIGWEGGRRPEQDSIAWQDHATDFHRVCDATNRHLMYNWCMNQFRLVSWNDKEGRTREEVLALIDEVLAVKSPELERRVETCPTHN